MAPNLDVAERLKTNKDRILSTWEERARREVNLVGKLDRAAVINSLPDLLDAMIATLRKAPPKRTADLEDELSIARHHANQRIQLGIYNLESVIQEYDILRAVILDILEEREPLARVDRDVILEALFF